MGTGESQHQERRQYPRYSCDLGVEVRVAGATEGYWGTLADICLGGCYVTTFSPLALGTAVVLVLKSQSLEISMSGTVVTAHPGVGMGVQFAGVPAEGQAHLKSLLEELAHVASQQIG
jgi:ABC-type Co2+ transport system permease subunit